MFKKQLAGMLDFIREQGVVGLAIGLAIGVQASAAVNSIVEGFINPIVGFILGGANLSELKWEIVHAGSDGGRELTIYWGSIADSLIKLVAVAVVIYFVIHGLKLDKLDKKSDKK